ncbi:MAG TPA: aminotransferase class I/II-fold pyridoxal phosphate-dependent enzyme [Candidatus Acidoferrales bacterium]|nr:aminotransferase class I/II-fold pyridoxal phosphate-dependent enzyme [Candidatus Acidoferrales bacterium]
MVQSSNLKRDPRSFLRDEYNRLASEELDWRIRVLGSSNGPWAVVSGKKVLMLCSNNYLNLTNHPKVKRAAIDAIEKFGAGSGSVRPIAGTMQAHVELEEALARYKGTEAALAYSTGFATNAGLLPQLAGEGDLIISDELNHGSIIDGVRLSRAEKTVYKHGDPDDLGRVLNEAEKKNFKHILIVTDGVFSMDGDIAPADRIVELADEHGAMTYVDDAHGDGVLGEAGRGITSHFHIENRVDVEMGTFSKAFGVVGGYIAGSRDLVNYALNKSRTWLLSGSHPASVVASCKASIEVVQEEPEHLRRLWDNTRYFKAGLRRLGFDTGRSETPITPVIVGQSSVARKMSEMLFESDVFALPIVFPMVARDKARIRTMMNAGHTRSDLDFALGAFEKAGKALGVT